MFSNLKRSLFVITILCVVVVGLVFAREYPIIEQYPIFHNLIEQYPNMVTYVPRTTRNGQLIVYSMNFQDDACEGEALCENIYVLNRQTGNQEQINFDENNNELRRRNDVAAVSPDGRYILFYNYKASSASTLVTYLRDMQTKTTIALNFPKSSDEVESQNLPLDISADGRYILYWYREETEDFIYQCIYENEWFDSYECGKLYLYDRNNGTRENIAKTHDGSKLYGNIINASMSDDARYIVFASTSSQHIPNDTNQVDDLFIRDRILNTTKRITLNQNGDEVFEHCLCIVTERWNLTVSPDGHYVSYTTRQQLVVEDTNVTNADVYLYDNLTNQNELISIDASGTNAVGRSYSYGLSDDGRFVSFSSFHIQGLTGNPAYCNPNAESNECDFIAFVRDRVTQTTTLVSHLNAEDGYKSRRTHINTMSGNGRFIIYPMMVESSPNKWTFFVAKGERLQTPTPTSTPTATPQVEPTSTPPPPTLVEFSLVVNGGFESMGSNDKPAAAWTAKNLNADDKRRCNQPNKPAVAYASNCAFRFKNAPNLNSQIRQKIDAPIINIGETVTFSAYASAKNLTGSVQIRAQIRYTDGTRIALMLNPPVGTYAYQRFTQSLLIEKPIATLKVIIGVANGEGRFVVDEVALESTLISDLGTRGSIGTNDGAIPLP